MAVDHFPHILRRVKGEVTVLSVVWSNKNHLSVVRSVGSIGIEVSNVDFFLIDFSNLLMCYVPP